MGVGSDLEGSTLPIMGLGKIGRRVAAVGRAFGMTVIAWSTNLTSENAEAAGATLVSKETLMQEADWLTLHMVLSDRSQGIVNAQDLARMKPTAWLINTARGRLVNEAALIEVLERRCIRGAALDVYEKEPLPARHPFRHLDNVLAAPHIGFVTEKTYRPFTVRRSKI